jgi:hypothetical protein
MDLLQMLGEVLWAAPSYDAPDNSGQPRRRWRTWVVVLLMVVLLAGAGWAVSLTF